MNFRNVFLVLFPSWNRLLCMGKNCMNWWGCLLLCDTPLPTPGLERSLCARTELSFRGPVKFPHWWHHDLPWPLFQYKPYISAVIASSGRALDAHPTCIHTLNLWGFIRAPSWLLNLSPVQLLATWWAEWLQGAWGFREGIPSRSVLMESSALYWLQWFHSALGAFVLPERNLAEGVRAARHHPKFQLGCVTWLHDTLPSLPPLTTSHVK